MLALIDAYLFGRSAHAHENSGAFSPEDCSKHVSGPLIWIFHLHDGVLSCTQHLAGVFRNQFPGAFARQK